VWPLTSAVNHNRGVWPLGSDFLRSISDQINVIPVRSEQRYKSNIPTNFKHSGELKSDEEGKLCVCVLELEASKQTKYVS